MNVLTLSVIFLYIDVRKIWNLCYDKGKPSDKDKAFMLKNVFLYSIIGIFFIIVLWLNVTGSIDYSFLLAKRYTQKKSVSIISITGSIIVFGPLISILVLWVIIFCYPHYDNFRYRANKLYKYCFPILNLNVIRSMDEKTRFVLIKMLRHEQELFSIDLTRKNIDRTKLGKANDISPALFDELISDISGIKAIKDKELSRDELYILNFALYMYKRHYVLGFLDYFKPNVLGYDYFMYFYCYDGNIVEPEPVDKKDLLAFKEPDIDNVDIWKRLSTFKELYLELSSNSNIVYQLRTIDNIYIDELKNQLNLYIRYNNTDKAKDMEKNICMTLDRGISKLTEIKKSAVNLAAEEIEISNKVIQQIIK